MEPISLTHEDFEFSRSKKPLKRIIRPKQKKRRVSIPETQIETMSTQDLHVDNLPSVLAHCTICIHHSTNRHRLTLVAEGMGATVVTELTTATTHLVIEPKNEAKAMKVIKQALSIGVTCSSPQWLMECYENKMYISATHFPYAMEKDVHVLSEEALVEDPFANDYVDYDAEEIRRANGGQTNLDEYITRRGQQQQENVTSAQGNRASSSTTPLVDHKPMDDHNDMPSTSQAYQTQEGILEEEEEMRREFYYNSNDSSVETTTVQTTIQESEEDMLKRKKLAEEKALQAQRAIQQRLSAMEKEPQRTKKTLQSGFGERLRIWYGEHAERSEVSRKRKAVQSVLGGIPTGELPPHQQPQPQQQQQQQQRIRSNSTATTVSYASSSASTSTTARRQTTATTSNARRQTTATTSNARRHPVQYQHLKKPKV